MTIDVVQSNRYTVPPVQPVQFKNRVDVFNYHSTIDKIARIAWDIFSIIILPIGLMRVFTSAIIVPGIGSDKKKLDTERNNAWDKNCERYSIETVDSVKLDTMIYHQDHSVKMQDRKFILFFNGNNGTYESTLPDLKKLSDQVGASIYCGNYRGVGYSEGTPMNKQDLIMDGDAMMHHLLSLGVQRKNILIHGWSLGGAVGAEVAALHQNENGSVSFCSDRSFSSLATLINHISFPVINKIAIGLIHLFNWNLDGFSAYKKINKKMILYNEADQVILPKASLAYAVNEYVERLNKYQQPQETDSYLTNVIELKYLADPHNSFVTSAPQFIFYHKKVREILGLGNM